MIGIAAPTAADESPPWLQALNRPLPEDRGGEDLRYAEDFLFIKQEIDKLQGCDYPQVLERCRTLLAERGKDLRVAGYLLLAASYVEGLAGLLEAVAGYRIIVESFWADCQPKKDRARAAALAWLNHGKLESFLRRHGDIGEPQRLKELRQGIDGLNRALVAALGDQAPQWTVLDKWLAGQLARSEKTSPARADESAALPVRSVQPAPRPAFGEMAAGIASERELVAATRGIRDYLLQNQEYLRAVGFSRALRWGSLGLPPDDQGRTRVPAPRQAGFNELRQLLKGGEHLAAFRLCENLFLEPGGQLCLDLQLHGCTSARALGWAEVTEFIAAQTAALVQRLPKLPGLSFESGQPFAEPATRAWIEGRLRGPVGETEEAESVVEEDRQKELAGRIAEARALLASNQLAAALALLKEYPVRDERQRLQLRLAMARLCLEAGRSEIAIPVLEELDATAERNALHLWDRGVAMEVWTLRLEALWDHMARTGGKEKDVLGEKLAELQARICRTDLEAAARLI